MIEDQPGTEGPYQPQGKLILPGYTPAPQNPDDIYNGYTQNIHDMQNMPQDMYNYNGSPNMYAEPQNMYGNGPYRAPVRPEDLLRRPPGPPLPSNPLARLSYYWNREPAYKFLIISVAVVLIAGLIFVGFTGVVLAQLASPTQGGQAISATTTPKAQSGTATPANNQAAAANQPTPTPTPTQIPTPSPTPTLIPTPTVAGPLTLQITSIPQQVDNKSTVYITVITNQPGTNVNLQVTYTNAVALSTSTNGPQQTDNNGAATLPWHINIFSFTRTATAHVTVVATDQNGQPVQSQTVDVKVNAKNNGGG